MEGKKTMRKKGRPLKMVAIIQWLMHAVDSNERCC